MGWGRANGQSLLWHVCAHLQVNAGPLQDMVVFMGLLHNIFPGVDPPRQRDLAFEEVIKQTSIELGLEPEEEFVRQVVQVSCIGVDSRGRGVNRGPLRTLPLSAPTLQLSELLAIRHCVFLMGPSGCGRTEVYRVLAKAITTGVSGSPSNPYLQANNRKKVCF